MDDVPAPDDRSFLDRPNGIRIGGLGGGLAGVGIGVLVGGPPLAWILGGAALGIAIGLVVSSRPR